MTAIDKLLNVGSLEELKEIKKRITSREKELKNVGDDAILAMLRGIVAKSGFDALKVSYAVVRKEEKEKTKSKAEADLEGLEEEGEEEEENERDAA